MTDVTIADLERTADRLTGHGIAGLTPHDWPVLVVALEDYIKIRRSVADWDNKVNRAVEANCTAALAAARQRGDIVATAVPLVDGTVTAGRYAAMARNETRDAHMTLFPDGKQPPEIEK